MATPSYMFGLSEFTTWPWSFERDVEEYARLGVKAIEVCEFKLDDARGKEQLESIEPHGLTVTSVQPATRTLFPSASMPSPLDVPARMARFRDSVERIAPFAPDAPFVTNTGIPPHGDIAGVLKAAATQYRETAMFAEAHGVRMALEPLNPTTMNTESSIWTIEQAMTLIQAVDHPAFGLCLDYWNIWQNPDVENAIKACGDRIFVVQLSDWRTPRSYQDRYVVGEGEIPLPPLVRATHEAGFRGAYSVEIFSHDVPDSLYEGDLAATIGRNKAGLDKVWQEAFATTQGQ